MIHERIEDLAATLPVGGALMGLDLGDKTIGVAVSDGLRSVASPLETIRRRKFGLDAARLLEIAAARRIGGIILGLPRNMDGSEAALSIDPRLRAQSGAADRIAHRLLGRKLSTVAAERALLEADASRKRRAEVIDNIAASYILQGVLDRLGHLRTEL